MSHNFSIIDTFVKKWNRNETPEHASNDDVSDVEKELNIILPSSYKYLITTYGDIYTSDILDAVVDKELDLNDIQNFELPAQSLKDSITWQKAGLPIGFYPFASDCMGNMFCFKNSECASETQEPLVWFFDYDFIEIEVVADDLFSWLSEYNEL